MCQLEVWIIPESLWLFKWVFHNQKTSTFIELEGIFIAISYFRTGRAGKSGEAVMVLSPYERAFHASRLSEFPMKEELRYDAENVMANKELTDLVKNSLSKAQFLSEQCYIAFLNFCIYFIYELIFRWTKSKKHRIFYENLYAKCR
jgi:hypothetical protein